MVIAQGDASALERLKRLQRRWQSTLLYMWLKVQLAAYTPAAMTKDKRWPHFRKRLFLVKMLIQPTIALVWAHCYIPKTIQHELQASPLIWFLTLFIASRAVGLFECLFHRFGMHKHAIFWFFSWWLWFMPKWDTSTMSKGRRFWAELWISIYIVIGELFLYLSERMRFGHGEHHKITNINKEAIIVKGVKKLTVRNMYEMICDERTERAVFPDLAPTIFCVFFSVVIIPLSHLFPNSPVLLAGYGMFVWQVILYELSHAAMHLPYNKYWARWIALPIVGKKFEEVYCLHFFHHMNVNCAYGVVGNAFPLPFDYSWDMLFNTYRCAKLWIVQKTATYAEENGIGVMDVSPEIIFELCDKDLQQAFDGPTDGPRGLLAWLDGRTKKSEVGYAKLLKFVSTTKEARQQYRLAA